MYDINILDLNFQGAPNAIASFLVRTPSENVLIESGPHSCFQALKAALHEYHLTPAEISKVFVTHVHLDHAGAAWCLAEKGAEIYVHPLGEKHLLNPDRLYNSAKRIYQDTMDELWGTMKGIESERVHSVDHLQTITLGKGDEKMISLHTPGHAKHHIAWQIGGDIFTGDVGGAKIMNGPVLPPCPPPDIDWAAWKQSIDLLRSKNAERLWLTHFGSIENVEKHLLELELNLEAWFSWMAEKSEIAQDQESLVHSFEKYVSQTFMPSVNDETLKAYDLANPAWMSVAGLQRALSRENDDSNF